MDAHPQHIFFLEDGNVTDFLDELESKDPDSYDAVVRRLDRVEEGNFGDYGAVGGVLELRFLKTGPGYRIYFGRDGDIVVLLRAGTKSTQDADYRIAEKLWEQYKNG